MECVSGKGSVVKGLAMIREIDRYRRIRSFISTSLFLQGRSLAVYYVGDTHYFLLSRFSTNFTALNQYNFELHLLNEWPVNHVVTI